MPWAIIHVKFRGDTLLKSKVLALIVQFVWQLYAIGVRYKGPTHEQFLEKKTCAKFQIDISKTEELARVYTVYTDGHA